MNDLILACDFGGTKLSAAVLKLGERTWRDQRRVPSPPDADAERDRATMIALGKELLGGARPAAVGISFGGPVIFDSGQVRLSHHVPGWEHTPLRSLFEEVFEAPCSVDNDGNVAALGEYRYGAGRGTHSLLYITVSTGVGGGWVLEGRVWRGAEGMAGEFGHITIDPNGPACVCGRRGCVERLASGPFIAARARSWLQERPDEGASLRRLVTGDLEAVTARHVAEAAAGGDALAREALEVAACALGIAIGSTANLMNPQRFVLGGGVTKSGEFFWSTLRHTAFHHAMPEVTLDIAPAAFEDDAPLWGAVALAEDLLNREGAEYE